MGDSICTVFRILCYVLLLSFDQTSQNEQDVLLLRFALRSQASTSTCRSIVLDLGFFGSVVFLFLEVLSSL